MIAIYPAQSRIKRFFDSTMQLDYLDKMRKEKSDTLKKNEFVVRNFILKNGNTLFHGILIGHKTTILNGKWVLQAMGNLGSFEKLMDFFAETYKAHNFNVVLINGPGVGRSEGEAVIETMGEAQEMGISFLEEAIYAKEIIIAGRSLGGASISYAVQNHLFKKGDVKYLVVHQESFNRMSNLAGRLIQKKVPYFKKHIKKFFKELVIWSRVEMSSVEASQMLAKQSIPHLIVQAGENSTFELQTLNNTNDQFNGSIQDDGLIPPKASLAYSVLKEKTSGKHFCMGRVKHGDHDTLLIPVKYFDQLAKSIA